MNKDAVPFEKRIWNAKTVCEYLGCSYDTFMKRDRYIQGFPEPLHAFDGKQPRWSAKAVTDWALQDSNHTPREIYATGRITA